MSLKDNNFYFIIGIIIIASFSRIIPHYPNFSPIIAIALFGGKYFINRNLAFFLPIFILWFSDLIINNFILDYYKSFIFFYPGFIWQYSCILIISYIGRSFLNNTSNLKLLGVSVSSSLIFFIISNFGVFISSSMYTKDLSGIILCYTLAIPFFINTLTSSVLYSLLLFKFYNFTIKTSYYFEKNNFF